MLEAAENLDFERAAFLRDQLRQLKELPQLIISSKTKKEKKRKEQKNEKARYRKSKTAD
jgi:excinuclease UvrABC nuclease subunit